MGGQEEAAWIQDSRKSRDLDGVAAVDVGLEWPEPVPAGLGSIRFPGSNQRARPALQSVTLQQAGRVIHTLAPRQQRLHSPCREEKGEKSRPGGWDGRATAPVVAGEAVAPGTLHWEELASRRHHGGVT